MEVMVGPATSATSLRSHPAIARSGPYAADAPWYVSHEPIVYEGSLYVKYGLPRVLGVDELKRIGTFRGIPVFGEVEASTRPDVLYLPVRPGCEFHPYQISGVK
ncbi:MAG TPA: hypothetical protein VF746_16155 [Longimicrobium sp.]